MAGSVNKVILVGNLGKDPEVRRLNSGEPVVNLSIATSENWRDKQSGERREKTEWHRVVIFNENLAKVAEQYLKKGSKVLIEGRLTPDKATGGPRIWNKQDGSTGASFEVTAGTVRFLSSRGEGPGEGPMVGGMEGAEIPAEDDIPF